MKIAVVALAALMAAFVPAAYAPIVYAQERAPDPVPIEEWSTDKVSAMGAAIYRQDVAAWVSTDALIAHLAGAPPPVGLQGWIVVKDGDDQRVRYIRRDEAGVLRSAFDVVVREGRAGAVQVVDELLTDTEQARFRARQTAIDNIGRLRCSQQLNTVVLDDPDSDGWLVWLLTTTSDANIIPFGGHYRFRISADGQTVLHRDMLSNSCMALPRHQAGQNGEPAALMVTQIVSQGPVETHVFLSLQNRIPIYVAAGEEGLFEVEGTEVRKIER